MTELEKKAEAFANEVEAEIGHCCGDNLNISAAELAARLTPLLVEVCEQREKERDDCVMLLKAVIAKKDDLQCLREKIVDYLQRKGLTSVLR